MKKIRKKRSHAPRMLGTREIALREAVRVIEADMEATNPHRGSTAKLESFMDVILPRLERMIASKEDLVAQAAIESYVRLRRMGSEWLANKASVIAQGIEAVATENIGRLQARVDAGDKGEVNEELVRLEMIRVAEETASRVTRDILKQLPAPTDVQSPTPDRQKATR